MAKSRQKKLDKMEIIERVREKVKPTFKFSEVKTPGKIIVNAKDLVLGYGEPLTKPINIMLERGQKVAIKGVNGLGKSTLLKTLLGMIPPVSGECELDAYVQQGYFEQEEVLSDRTALDEIWAEYPSFTNGEVRAALAKCGADHEPYHKSDESAVRRRENAKVRICKLMLKDVNFLVLDEPTNHLDTDAKEALQKAIIEFKGTVLLVCHEPEFYEGWVTHVWNVENWTNKIV